MKHNQKNCWFCICNKNISAIEIVSLCKTLSKFGYLDDDWWCENECPVLDDFLK